MRHWMMALTLVGLGWASVQTASAEDCDASQAAMNACAGNELKQVDAELNKQYQAQMAYLKDPERKQALKSAQLKWIAFRDADCLYQVGKPEDSGSIWPGLQAQCQTALTKQRVEQLKAYVACRADGCPN